MRATAGVPAHGQGVRGGERGHPAYGGGVTPGMSTSRTTAAVAVVPASAARPARSDEPMPLAQSPFSVQVRAGAAARTRPASAPTTTSVRVSPARAAVSAARSTSRLPCHRTNAFGIP
ncbi:hypothetical protein Asp14428_67820 [Actinoplanes sp. NBRC 14428]|nr:hypothetical protein Asp14428_67820 [Actinoplanes sp. NBRC 14428]